MSPVTPSVILKILWRRRALPLVAPWIFKGFNEVEKGGIVRLAVCVEDGRQRLLA
jgi:hypothetical protein